MRHVRRLLAGSFICAVSAFAAAFCADVCFGDGSLSEALTRAVRERAQVPVQRPMMVLVAQVSFAHDEVGAHGLAIRVIDADGGNILPPVDGQITFNAPDEALSPVAQVVVELNLVTFPRFGVYSVELAIDGRSIASLPIEVLPAA